MSFYRSVNNIREHDSNEEFIKIGEIRYLKKFNIFYECTEFGMKEPYYDKQTQVLRDACSWCVFGDSRFTYSYDCKRCTPEKRVDRKNVIFREINLLLNR